MVGWRSRARAVPRQHAPRQTRRRGHEAQVTSTTKPASLAPFEVDKDDETCFSGYRLQITARLRGGGPAAAPPPAAPPAPAARPAPRARRSARRRRGRSRGRRPKAHPGAAAAAERPRRVEVGAWARLRLYAKKGPKKRITWIDGEVVRGDVPRQPAQAQAF